MKRIAAAMAVVVSFTGFAQNYIGIPQSNYSGVMGTDLNPASFVDGRFKVDINLGSFNVTGWQNAQTFTTIDMPKWWTKSFKPDDKIVKSITFNTNTGQFDTTYSTLHPGGSNPYNDWMVDASDTSNILDTYFTRNYDATSTGDYGIYNNIQVDVLNFMFHINRKIAVGAAVKFRSVTNVDDVAPQLAMLGELDFLSDSLDAVNLAPSLWNQKFDEGLLDMNHMSWMEYGLIYSQVLKDEGEHFWKLGGKAKWLSGISAAYIHTDDFKYTVLNDSTFSHLSGEVDYGHSAGLLDKIGKRDQNGDPIELGFGDFMESASKFGLGLDLGVVYEWRPDWKEYKYDMDGETDLWRRDKEKYKIRAGLSILDIGGMKFQKGGLSRNFTVNSDNPWDFRAAFDPVNEYDDNWTGPYLGTVEQIDSVINYELENNPDWTANEDVSQTFFMSLPTAVSMQFDYNIYKWFYVNATGMINVQNRKNPHRVRRPNQFSITPSFDHAWFGLHLPFQYNRYSGVRAGIGTRLGPLTVGIMDYGMLFASGKKKRGVDFYAGFRVPVLYSHPSDVDGDLVSDDNDECLVVPGLWEFKGCPDSDRDGIKDLDDHCPQEPGLPEFNGCPDKDGDKIPDKDDACPDLPGDIKFNGCPDRDNDSIIDPKDDCPDVPGLAKFNGCPDTDGDGIKDSDDACPEVPGPLVNNGCPDTDNDGLFDFIDNCPEVYGPKENNGCPWPDTDEDGILDKDDDCPNIKGPKANNGCPYIDTDGDGVLDKDDECPSTPGPVANKGCPEIEKEVEEILRTAFENLEFETAKDIIKDASIPSLTELAEVLVKKPEWKLQIAGHTDNVGNAQSNLVLSKKRAEAVKAFMVSKGIAADRLSVLYFGETQPIADNNTPEGRQKNRRVEMTIIFN